MTADSVGAVDWLLGHGVTHVAMESTGEYWKPVYNILEETFELLLVNPQHIKAVPGRKTDVNDAEWIAELFAVWTAACQFRAAQGNAPARTDTRTHHICA